ncbi:TATA element modulatory factor 1 TATA binding-domain-containing protein [Entophlyctis helioformis]|nr:TATA element modulatory factor 1 TATA binding-domain-containing protein [Entophlyctis helioformis]
MSSWLTSSLTNLASGDGAAALTSFVKQAVSTVESGIDRVLDIQPDASAAAAASSSSSAETARPAKKGYDEAPSFSGLLDFGAGFVSAKPLSKSSSRAALQSDNATQRDSKPSVRTEDSFFDMLGGFASSATSAISPALSIPAQSSSKSKPPKPDGPQQPQQQQPRQVAAEPDLVSMLSSTPTAATGNEAAAARRPSVSLQPEKRNSGFEAYFGDIAASGSGSGSASVPQPSTDLAGDQEKVGHVSTDAPTAKLHDESTVAPAIHDDAIEAAEDNDRLNADAAVEIEASQSKPSDASPSSGAQPTTDGVAMAGSPKGAAVAAETQNAASASPTADQGGNAQEGDDANHQASVVENAQAASIAQETSEAEPASVAHDAKEKQRPQAAPLEADALELQRLKSIVDQREQQLFGAAQQNATLNDQISRLQAAIADAQKAHSGEVASFKNVIAQLRSRVKELEEQVQQLQAERTSLQQTASSEGASQARINELSRALMDKEESVKGLLAEGENLAKEILKANNNVKKLRAKETEMDKELKDAQRKLEATLAELAQLKDKHAKLVESERELTASNNDFVAKHDQQIRQIHRLEKDLGNAREKAAEIQAMYDQTVKQLDEIKKMESESKVAAQAEALEKEMRANEEIHGQLEQMRAQAEAAETALRKEIYELRNGLSRLEDESGWKEENYRREINARHLLDNALQLRLQAADARNEDMSVIGQDATKPLLRQIESLQAQHSSALRDWEQIERTLTLRLQDVEHERAQAVESERSLKDRVMDMNTRIATLEAQNSRERQDKSRLAVDIEEERSRAVELDKRVHDLGARLDKAAAVHAAELEAAKAEFEKRLEARLQEEAEKWDARVKAEQRLRLQQIERINSVRGGDSRARLSVSSSSLDGDEAASPTEQVTSPTRVPLGTPSLVAIERLQTTIKSQESQMSSLQLQLQMATRTRDEMADELVKITNESEDLKTKLAGLEDAESRLAQLEKRYNAALELLGEKTERVEELQADIEDMKVAFKAQVENLVQQLASVRR